MMPNAEFKSKDNVYNVRSVILSMHKGDAYRLIPYVRHIASRTGAAHHATMDIRSQTGDAQLLSKRTKTAEDFIRQISRCALSAYLIMCLSGECVLSGILYASKYNCRQEPAKVVGLDLSNYTLLACKGEIDFNIL